MDSKDSQNKAVFQLRRSTRQSSVKMREPTPRDPIKKSKRKKVLDNEAPDPAVNGSEDEESPSKKIRLHLNGAGDENEMDIQESGKSQQKTEEQKMDIEVDIYREIGIAGDVNLHPRVVLGEPCKFSHVVISDNLITQRGKPMPSLNSASQIRPTERRHEAYAPNPTQMEEKITVQQSKKESGAPPKVATQVRPLERSHDAPAPNFTSMAEYKRKMEEKITDTHKGNHYVPRAYAASDVSKTTRQRVSNILPPKTSLPDIKKEGKKKTAVKPQTSGSFLKGSLWYLCHLILLVLVSCGVFLAYKNIPVLQRTRAGAGPPLQSANSGIFIDRLSLLEAQFPSQRPDLWKRSKIHLQRHLETAQPTEPVSLILTAGLGAQRTLRCLANGLASAFSSALNASVLHIDGASKADQDSDEVKLDIDSQLRAAFEGDKPVAVIHRFEELPPGSTIIFYRYCDHENAAYKQVFLLFTVLLPQDEVEGQKNLKEVEEMVQDYVKERLVGNETAFNKMDTDKYGGLWSRISHLILPVTSEREVEQRGC
ncbi:torsin-1A-interacting protein 2-like isoform X1 [Sphaeramia orbicularis]|uniref:torsin-1A-interacting protein 2-like isoform X1 n=1 Tax=Sphaeramia orbicularis TaxID=375764 RepID=UPI00117CD4F4|nr:torsin-1A-interacting protein 2-like isoform X1 [Sphaeramia orbicularis]